MHACTALKVEKPLNYYYLCSELVKLRLRPFMTLPSTSQNMQTLHHMSREGSGKASGAGPECVPGSLCVQRPGRGPEILPNMVVPSWVGVEQHQARVSAASP